MYLLIFLILSSNANSCSVNERGTPSADCLETRQNVKFWKGKSILQRRAERLFWGINHIRQDGVSNEKVLQRATNQVKKACETIFRFEPWNCTIKRETFKKASRETGVLYASLASSIADRIARDCAKGQMNSFCKSCNPDWPNPGCSQLNHACEYVSNFLSLKPQDGHIQHNVLVHNSLLGLKILLASGIKKCKCHGFSGACSSKTCWNVPSPFVVVLAHLKIKYQLAQQWQLSNRIKTPIINKLPNLGYIDPSEDFCKYSKGRACSDVKNCEEVCCGRNYTGRIVKQRKYCDCRWYENYELKCNICLTFDTEFDCI
ncbi:protein Wnt-4-like [Cimex lectularius]|uniref:Protein Wnt n=1 Tax=Cimex lectularius TaxID=79782 RepID=A0A8I6RN66_CIMLE|nr:protein Wnt-4-like [Cimex lectularius]